MNPPDAETRAGPGPADDVADRLRRATRRGFATAGVSLFAGLGAWRWLASRPGDDGLAWPLRRVLQANERLGRAAFRPSRLAPEFAPGRSREPRINGVIGMGAPAAPVPAVDPSSWRLSVGGGPAGGAAS